MTEYLCIAPDVKLSKFINLYGCEIGDNTKIGASAGSGATIPANVVIGEKATVGAGSVVAKDVPANAIVAGNSAKVAPYITGPSRIG